ncbi:conserved hypothetical protein [Verticillium alfalfae VaMs.102]|uniref:Cytochrome b5 heme-binding domain-containing protein n=1 Tax=Verticillium alfalfae (strain VaMs.102 / ATCC MYA-4576 / FGSC 10136) TaxID=526221 RepID=C9SLC0_VERA1|nr:conserved hypothetical protein [Verticillium alfalfae VaMs.102]EEY19488.1 conserved hypothetical protein [Verticillium alfalfae VaMs.102]
MAEATTARQRKKEPVAIPIVPDEECGSEDDDNLFAGTPSEKLSRKTKSKAKTGTKAKAARTDDGETDAFSPLIDVLRVLSFLAVASCALSYVMSSGESFTWGFDDKPWYLRPSYWKLRWNGPLYLTPAELRAYDGTTPDTPIYLAINHTIYDVSANPRSYGPGGSYHLFAGHDASRAFVTGCFAEDRVPDMRGVETMYLPLDDADVDRHWSYAELEALRAAEREAAAQKVHDALQHWVDFFGNSEQVPARRLRAAPRGLARRRAPCPACATRRRRAASRGSCRARRRRRGRPRRRGGRRRRGRRRRRRRASRGSRRDVHMMDDWMMLLEKTQIYSKEP